MISYTVRNTVYHQSGNWFPYQETHPDTSHYLFGDFTTFFGNNFLLLQCFLIRKLLLDKVILPSS